MSLQTDIPHVTWLVADTLKQPFTAHCRTIARPLSNNCPQLSGKQKRVRDVQNGRQVHDRELRQERFRNETIEDNCSTLLASIGISRERLPHFFVIHFFVIRICIATARKAWGL